MNNLERIIISKISAATIEKRSKLLYSNEMEIFEHFEATMNLQNLTNKKIIREILRFVFQNSVCFFTSLREFDLLSLDLQIN